MPQVDVRYHVLPHGEGLQVPSYQTPGSAGCDLRAAIVEPMTLAPGERKLVPLGFRAALPQGWEAQIRPRSGLAIKHGITVLNGPGTIDADYRGEWMVPLINLGHEPFTIERGERVCQMILAPVYQARFHAVDELDDTERGSGGFGSTGTR